MSALLYKTALLLWLLLKVRKLLPEASTSTFSRLSFVSHWPETYYMLRPNPLPSQGSKTIISGLDQRFLKLSCTLESPGSLISDSEAIHSAYLISTIFTNILSGLVLLSPCLLKLLVYLNLKKFKFLWS